MTPSGIRHRVLVRFAASALNCSTVQQPTAAVGPKVTSWRGQVPLGARSGEAKTDLVNVHVQAGRARSHSSSILLTRLIRGPRTRGVIMGPRQLRFGDYVVSLTAPGEPRMPNGVECSVKAGPRMQVEIGRGGVLVGRLELDAGAEWDPVPVTTLRGRPQGPAPLVGAMAEWESDVSTAAVDMLAGYVAGLVLLHGSRTRAADLARSAMIHADPLNATLLRHAARGEVPEPVHALLQRADPRPLLTWGRAGGWWLRGLLSAGFPLEDNLAFVAAPLATTSAS
jgi:hypothetical protein